MSTRTGKSFKLVYFVVGIIILTAALIVGANLLFGENYFDLTGDGRYSLSRETEEFLKKNTVPVSMRLYVSRKAAKKDPAFGRYTDYVHRLISEYQEKSGGMLNLSVVDVEPFESTQAEAEKAGIREFKFADGRRYFYLGASFTNPEGRTLAVSRFVPERMDEIEGDITRVLSVLTSERRPRLGILSPYFRAADEKNPLKYAENLPFVKELENRGYEIVPLSDVRPFVPEGIDTVLVFYPLNLNAAAVYALDQYLMWGGRIMIMTDVFSEERFRGKETYIGYVSGIRRLLRNAGIIYREDILAGDNVNSRELVLDGRKIKYPFWLAVESNTIFGHDIMKGIRSLRLDYSGFFEFIPQEGLRETILFSTGRNSGVMRAEKVADISYENLLKNYQLTDEEYPLAILVEGNFKSLFDRPIVSDPKILSELPPFLSVPVKEGCLLLVGDADMAAPFLWNAKAGERYEAYEAATLSDNISFMQNALDYLSQSGYAAVPRKQNRQAGNMSQFFYRAAADAYAGDRKQLTDMLAEIKQKISEARDQTAADALPSVKQLKELEELQRQEINTEEKLRRTSYLIGERYQDYLSWFAFVIIGVLPLISILVARGFYFWYNRSIRRKAEEFVNE